MAVAFWNNWQQDEEFNFIFLDVKFSEGYFVWSLGVCGIGFVLAIELPF